MATIRAYHTHFWQTLEQNTSQIIEQMKKRTQTWHSVLVFDNLNKKKQRKRQKLARY